MEDKMALSKVLKKSPYMGCDPEFFFRTDKGIIGAEKVFKPEGLVVKSNSYGDSKHSKFIIDGVQAELNPKPNTCRANLANEIAYCFKTLKEDLKKKGANISIDLSRSVTISEEALKELDEKNQKFGCAPSFTVYKNPGVKLTKVDPLKYLSRSAGGHIHIGFDNYPNSRNQLTLHHKEFVQLLDIICGNTLVLVDRDKSNVKRRRLYGRAGEYRLPAHGLEYRTPSNFWLTSAQMMSLAFGLARLAFELFTDEQHWAENIKTFTEAVDMKDIKKAINKNDYKLALANFMKIKPLLEKVTGSNDGHFPFDSSNMKEFLYFAEKVNERGIDFFFPEDSVTHWVNLPEAHNYGFNDYLNTTVRPLMNLEASGKYAIKQIK
jgi:hypothetical protein